MFDHQPETPAMSRWTGCTIPSRWYLLAQSTHFLLFQGWSLLYWGQVDFDKLGQFGVQSEPQGAHLPELTGPGCSMDLDLPTYSAAGDASGAGDALVQHAEASTAASLLTQCTDADADRVRRAERVRAKKAGQWMAHPLAMISDLALALTALAPSEKYLCGLLAGQHSGSWKGLYGIGLVPLVLYVQPFKSLSARALDTYMVLQRAPMTMACPVVAGFCRNDEAEYCRQQAKLFQLLLVASSILWKRQYLPYTRAPWKFLAVLDDISQLEKRSLVEEFRALTACMMDKGCTRVLHKFYGHQSPEQLLSISGDFFCALRLLALNKVSNVEIELNFARASSSRQYMRGNAHDASTMAAKHVAAELRHQHNLALQRKQSREKHRLASLASQGLHGLGSSSGPGFHLPAPGGSGSASSAVLSRPLATRRARRHKGARRPWKANGWIMYMADRVRYGAGEVGESRETRRKRVFAQARADWETQITDEDKRRFSKRAKAANAEARIVHLAGHSARAKSKRKRGQDGPVAVFQDEGPKFDSCALQRGAVASCGDSCHSCGEEVGLNIEDAQWPLSKEALAEASRLPCAV